MEIAFEAPRTRHLIPHVYSRPVLDPNRLAPFVDPLLMMPRARPSGARRDPEGFIAPLYQMRMSEFYHQVHRDLPPTRVWGFNGSVPGPTFEVRSGSPVLVDWINALPAKHFLPIDHTIHGARKDTPEVRTVIHLHGAKAPARATAIRRHGIRLATRRSIFIPTGNARRCCGITITLWESCG